MNGLTFVRLELRDDFLIVVGSFLNTHFYCERGEAIIGLNG
jgi:hypothetical protein